MLLVKIMGCICSKGASERETADPYEKAKASVHLVNPSSHKRDNFFVEIGGSGGGGGGGGGGSVHRLTRTSSRAAGSVHRKPKEEGSSKSRMIVVERPSSGHNYQRWAASSELGPPGGGGGRQVTRIVSVVGGGGGGEDSAEAAGWPSWLTSVAGDAIRGLVPRRADSFEKLDKVSPYNICPFFFFFFFFCFFVGPFVFRHSSCMFLLVLGNISASINLL